MSFSLVAIIGAGTITVAANSASVAGTGTAFATTNVGAILVQGSQWGVVAQRISTSNVILDRPFATAVTGAAYQIL